LTLTKRSLVLLLLTNGTFLPACHQSIEIGVKSGGETVDAMRPPDVVQDTTPPPPDLAPPFDAPLDVAAEADGADPGILWSSDFETGDLSEWMQGGMAVGGTNQHLVTVTVSPDQAQHGQSSAKIVFSAADGQDHLAEFYRKVADVPAYYSAWFYINEAHTPGPYWQLLYFFYEDLAGNAGTRHGLWTFNMNSKTIFYYNEKTRDIADTVPSIPYPVGRWFHFEVYFAYDPPRNGHLTVWQDGVQVMDLPNQGAPPNDNLYWAIGSETDKLTPAACTMYVDDAAISTRRLGP